MKKRRPDQRDKNGRDTEVFNMRMKKSVISRLRIAAEKDRRTMANLASVLIENGLTTLENG